MRFTRFERKIMAALAAVAFIPLVATLVLGRTALQDVYEVGVNARVREQLHSSLDVYREHFVALRHDAVRTADALVADWRLRGAIESRESLAMRAALDAALERHANVVAMAVQDQTQEVLVAVERPEADGGPPTRRLEFERTFEGLEPPSTLSVTIATPAAPFFAYQRAGELTEVYSRLDEGAGYVFGTYLAVYIGFLLSVITVVLALGIVLSRRVTRRVADLAEATERVGAGDLTVQVSSDAKDEVGELTRAFNEMVRDLRESRERIDYLQRIGAWQEFARRLAHEIKNPLTPIQLAVQEVHQGYGGADEDFGRKLAETRAIVEEEVATLRRLVGEFSAFAKLPEAQLSTADLRTFVADLQRSFGAMVEDGLAGEAPPEVRCDLPEEPLPVRIDTMMLKRCVDNLVRNATQALSESRPGGGGLIVVTARRDGSDALLVVRDNGPGVRDQARARVFDPYYTTRSDGTGLGLAIVKKVVLEHQGEIECEASPEGGAAFCIRLPLHGDGSSRRRSRPQPRPR